MTIKLKTQAWDAAENLDTEEDMAAYLEAALEDGDPAHVGAALAHTMRAKSVTQIARDTGLSPKSIYNALSSNGNPKLVTILKVINALGLKLQAATTNA